MVLNNADPVGGMKVNSSNQFLLFECLQQCCIFNFDWSVKYLAYELKNSKVAP